MNIALFETAGKQKYNAGSKARQDALQIAKQAGYRHIVLFHNGYWKPYIPCEIIVACLKTICLAGKNDKVFIQYPYFPSLLCRLFFLFLSTGKRIKKYAVIMLLHDVPSLKEHGGHSDEALEKLSREVKAWSWMDRVICHNEHMRAILKKAYPYDQYDVLGVFDYLYDGPICERHYEKQPVVIVSGNLSAQSTGFLYHLPSNLSLQIKLFGPNYTGTSTNNVAYCGKYPSNELILRLDGQFGLVWYGNSCDTCDGNIGEYLPYINPHKFSAYIAAGLPVVVWSKSALAKLVVTKNVGLAVESIAELEEKLQDIDEAQYQTMLQNVLNMREDIIEGKYLGRLL